MIRGRFCVDIYKNQSKQNIAGKNENERKKNHSYIASKERM